MQLIVASRYAGFCRGVKRAWRLTLDQIATGRGPVYLSGDLIHNGPAMRELESKGVRVLASSSAYEGLTGTLVIRAHGEGPEVYKRAVAAGLAVVDATCQIVRAAQSRALELEQQGYQVILFGHRSHPEASATLAHTRQGIIVENPEEARQLGYVRRIALLAQTTAPQWDYEAVRETLRARCDDLLDEGRVCAWTVNAQREAEGIARCVDAMIVIGGSGSSNTRRLVDVCSRYCPSYHIEIAENIDAAWIAGLKVVGVTAGASTRDEDIKAVVQRLQDSS